jgi:histidine triad (HIT) family protein
MPCTFCEIVAGRAPAHIIEEDALSIALLDINPFAEGHCLIVSKRHEPWWNDLADDEIASVFAMAKRVANRLRATFSPEFICMYARGRRIPHTHIFLVPSTSGDVLDGFFNAMERVQESPQHLAALKTPEALASAERKIRDQSS